MRKATVYVGSILAGLMMAACGNDSSNSPGNPAADTARVERNDGLSQAVKTACDAYTKCHQVGPSAKYSSRQDCEIKVKDDFNSKWSEKDCGGAKAFIKAKFDECLNRNAQWNCEGNFFDKFGFETECSASNVCAPK